MSVLFPAVVQHLAQGRGHLHTAVAEHCLDDVEDEGVQTGVDAEHEGQELPAVVGLEEQGRDDAAKQHVFYAFYTVVFEVQQQKGGLDLI